MAQVSAPELLDYLPAWMSRQRWYAGKGRTPQLKVIGSFDLHQPTGTNDADDVSIRVYLVLDQAESPMLYQVPLAVRMSPVAGAEHTLVAITGGDNPRYIYDGPRDPAFAEALLWLILNEETSGTSRDDAVLVHGHSLLPQSDVLIASSRVLSGEQSNTSIIYELTDAHGTPVRPVICKLFRALHHGDNPDVVLLSALGSAGSRVVPQSVGYVSGQWPDTGRPNGIASGHLAFAQEFLPGVEDAWRVTVRAAEAGLDFTVAARALGEATAEVHEALAATMGTVPCTPAKISEMIGNMRRRLDQAISEVPEITEHRDAIDAMYGRAANAPWPPLQRIHGDLHLGQVLAVPDRGWVLLDFEGEPLRPMSERSVPDVPLRDVAGMLRSFDYVAGTYALAHPGESAKDWSLACRRAFVDGYSARSGHDLRANRVLLDTFEIDKAIYEAVYEARNRPAWLSIPTDAIGRLAARATVG
jgi:trehalose synthase-fused probable maltokinase